MSNLPNTKEWRPFASTLQLTEKADTVVTIITHLLFFTAHLRRASGRAPDAALFITKKGPERHSKGEKG
jgi:hypothetical protein